MWLRSMDKETVEKLQKIASIMKDQGWFAEFKKAELLGLESDEWLGQLKATLVRTYSVMRLLTKTSMPGDRSLMCRSLQLLIEDVERLRLGVDPIFLRKSSIKSGKGKSVDYTIHRLRILVFVYAEQYVPSMFPTQSAMNKHLAKKLGVSRSTVANWVLRVKTYLENSEASTRAYPNEWSGGSDTILRDTRAYYNSLENTELARELFEDAIHEAYCLYKATNAARKRTH